MHTARFILSLGGVMALLVALSIGCASPAPYNDFTTKLAEENIDPNHFVVGVVLEAQCKAHSETGFIENYQGERKFIGASNARIEPLILQYNDTENEIISATILAMRATINGGTDMKVFCESQGHS